jgi:hypothetical protein
MVRVRRQWNDWREANVPLSVIECLHWANKSGGVRAAAPQYFLHGYIWCDALEGAEFGHSCAHGRGPHRIKICITKKGNDPTTFYQLVKEVGPKPKGAMLASPSPRV